MVKWFNKDCQQIILHLNIAIRQILVLKWKKNVYTMKCLHSITLLGDPQQELWLRPLMRTLYTEQGQFQVQYLST